MQDPRWRLRSQHQGFAQIFSWRSGMTSSKRSTVQMLHNGIQEIHGAKNTVPRSETISI